MPKITTQWQRFDEFSTDQLYELLRFRQQIFVVEQRSSYPDLDGFDRDAWHLLLNKDRILGGYLRLLPASAPGSPLSIGRVAVAQPLRRQGIGRRMLDEALHLCRRHHPGQPITLRAQLHLAPFYETFGFAAISEPFDDFGIMHVEMRAQGLRT